MRRALRRRRRAVVAGLAMTAAALVLAGPRGQTRMAPTPAERTHAQAERGGSVAAPVRIADAAAVRLLCPGDLVDVLAGSRLVAAGAPVVSVPGTPEAPGAVPGAADGGGEGALVVLSVPRATARTLAGAATATTPLAVTMPSPEGGGHSTACR